MFFTICIILFRFSFPPYTHISKYLNTDSTWDNRALTLETRPCVLFSPHFVLLKPGTAISFLLYVLRLMVHCIFKVRKRKNTNSGCNTWNSESFAHQNPGVLAHCSWQKFSSSVRCIDMSCVCLLSTQRNATTTMFHWDHCSEVQTLTCNKNDMLF